jgi:site-specific DNA-methyltransferase (adenine-specific)
MSVELLHMDCMDYMKTLPDKAFDLAIVDPPYGIDAGNMVMGKGKNKDWGGAKNWDTTVPSGEYFAELVRVSAKQIVWGGNYFDLPKTGGWLFWDKERGKEVSFADGELAWTSFLNVLKRVPVRYDGFLGADISRIHPTQKPIKLYEWLLKNYAKPGDRILDTHLGSGSSAIAAHYGGFDFVGTELDADYYAAAVARFNNETRQQAMML